jgi:predicted transcriptional regulator
MQVKEIMTSDVISVSPDMEVHKLAELFIKEDISGAPVIDKDGSLLGVALEEGLIFQDKKVHLPTFIYFAMGFLTLGAHKLDEEMKRIAGGKVADIMDKDMAIISPETSVEEVATIIVEKKKHYFPVLKDNTLVGVVTKKDIIRAIAEGKL